MGCSSHGSGNLAGDIVVGWADHSWNHGLWIWIPAVPTYRFRVSTIPDCSDALPASGYSGKMPVLWAEMFR